MGWNSREPSAAGGGGGDAWVSSHKGHVSYDKVRQRVTSKESKKHGPITASQARIRPHFVMRVQSFNSDSELC